MHYYNGKTNYHSKWLKMMGLYETRYIMYHGDNPTRPLEPEYIENYIEHMKENK